MSLKSIRRKKQITNIQISKKAYLIIGSVLVVVLAVFSVFYYLLANAFDQNRVIVATYKNGSYTVYAYNLAKGNVATLFVPGNTYVSVARQRGSWRLESAAKFIQTEKLGGQTYADTIMKAFGIPVDYWQMGISTNLSIPQRIRLFLIKNKFTDNSNININLFDTHVLKEATLPDGEEGYLVSSDLSADIKRLFIDENFVVNGYRVEIQRNIDKNYQSATDLIEVLTTVGLHVVNIKREPANNTNCMIEAKEDVLVDRLKELFDCDVSIQNEGNLDIRIKIGNRFAERF